MITIFYQDSEIIILSPYTFTGRPDGIYIKTLGMQWNGAVIGDDYKVLISRPKQAVIQITNEYYTDKYIAIEPSLIGDVLILGAGLQTIDAYLTTGTSWKWVEINPYLAGITPSNGIMYEGDANDIEFLSTLGTFDTILIDFPYNNPLNDYASLLNPGGTIIEFQI